MNFDEFVGSRGAALLRFAYLLVGERHTAQDVTQAALADALVHWGRVVRAGHPEQYVRRMIINRYLQGRRRRSSGEISTADPADGSLLHPDEIGRVADRDQVDRLLASLPPRARAVLVMRYFLDLDDQTVAQELGITTSTVRSIASRALGTLRLQPVPHEEGGHRP